MKIRIWRAGAFLERLQLAFQLRNGGVDLGSSRLLRKAAARTRDELWTTLGCLLDACPPAQCGNYLRHCGYGST